MMHAVIIQVAGVTAGNRISSRCTMNKELVLEMTFIKYTLPEISARRCISNQILNNNLHSIR
jgi:hypothetical protein